MTSKERPPAEWQELWARGWGTKCLPQRTGRPKLRLLHQRRGLSASRVCWGAGDGRMLSKSVVLLEFQSFRLAGEKGAPALPIIHRAKS